MYIDKKKIQRLISFCVFLLILWYLFVHLTYLFRSTEWYKLNIPVFRTEEEESIDVVLIGGSSVYEGWNPLQAFEDHGIVSYNYSAASMPAATCIFAIRDVLETQTPSLILVDIRKFCSIHWDTTISGNLRNTMDAQDINLRRSAAIEYYRDLNDLSIKDALSEHLDIIYYHDNLRILANELNWESCDNRLEQEFADMYYENGFYPGVEHIFMEEYGVDHPVTEEADISKKIEKCYRDLLKFCTEKEVPLLLVASPFAMTEADAAEINSFERIAREYQVPFLNTNKFYKEMGLDFHTDFVDTQHLNIFGARKYTNFLGSYLTREYNIPDRKEESKYKSWGENMKNIVSSKWKMDINCGIL